MTEEGLGCSKGFGQHGLPERCSLPWEFFLWLVQVLSSGHYTVLDYIWLSFRVDVNSTKMFERAAVLKKGGEGDEK